MLATRPKLGLRSDGVGPGIQTLRALAFPAQTGLEAQ